MLRWRLIIGVLLTAALAWIFWLDVHSSRPGLIYLGPLVLGVLVLATDELLTIFRRVGIEAHTWSIQLATVAAVASAFLPLLRSEVPGHAPFDLAGGMIVGMILIVVTEVVRYGPSQKSLLNLAAGAWAVLYLGGGVGTMILLRQIPIGGDMARGGMFVLLTTLAVVKGTDIGAYTVGRLWGKNKMAPVLSPGKTWEGFTGGLLAAVVIAALMLGPLATAWGIDPLRERPLWLAASLFGLVVGVAGIIGDLVESLLKREAGVKDSSSWLPGFGGVLDIVDSPLLAAPIAYFLWNSGVLTG